jgi:hypothetical protein
MNMETLETLHLFVLSHAPSAKTAYTFAEHALGWSAQQSAHHGIAMLPLLFGWVELAKHA